MSHENPHRMTTPTPWLHQLQCLTLYLHRTDTQNYLDNYDSTKLLSLSHYADTQKMTLEANLSPLKSKHVQ